MQQNQVRRLQNRHMLLCGGKKIVNCVPSSLCVEDKMISEKVIDLTNEENGNKKRTLDKDSVLLNSKKICARAEMDADATTKQEATDEEGNNSQLTQGEKISPDMIEKMVKMFKTHRCALDFEGKYIVKIKQA